VPALDLMPMDEMLARLHRVLAASPADETEIAWLEVRRCRAETGQKRPGGERRVRTLLVRVRESGRTGFHRTGEIEVSDLENAVRMAMAQARLSPPLPPDPIPSIPPIPLISPAQPLVRPTARGPELWDGELAELGAEPARELVQRLAGRSGAARLDWATARVALARNDGRLRSAEVTAASLAVHQGRGPGAGSAATAARSLARLIAEGPQGVAERARRREAPEVPQGVAELPPGPLPPLPLLLSAEATAALIDLLNRVALSASSFREGTSFLGDRLGQPVFHPALSLCDDGTDAAGLPFPFDLLGEAKRPIDLIDQGVVLTPAIDAGLAERLGRAPTPHTVALDESVASHLFVLPGACDEDELLRRTDGGLWVGSLSPIEGLGLQAARFRAVARGVRRIVDGALGPAFPHLVWEASFAAALGPLLGVGRETVVVAGDEPLLGGTSAPCLALAPSASLVLAK
jgi:PmbA protein